MGPNFCTGAWERRSSSLIRRLPQFERSYDLWFVQICVHRLIYWLTWRGPHVSTLNANSNNMEVQIANEEGNKAAFTSHHVLFCFNDIPLGLENVDGTFWGAVDVLLANGKWKSAIVDSNDVVIFSCNPDEHIDHCWQVLALLYDFGASSSLKMLIFHKSNHYLGHGISPTDLEV